MRKIYSLVLMAAALLVGTNAWANLHDTENVGVDQASVTINGNTQYAEYLWEAFDEVSVDGTFATITLLQNVELDRSIVLYVPADQMSNPGKNIELNMNNKNISTASDTICTGRNINTEITTTGAHTPFILFKGKLNITGKGRITNTFNQPDLISTSAGWPYWVATGITVCGLTDNSALDAVKLTVGEEVTVVSTSMAGIGFYVFTGFDTYPTSANSYFNKMTDGYFGIKESEIMSKIGYTNYPDSGSPLKCGWGINAKISGHVIGNIYGIYMTGNIAQKPSFNPQTDPTNYIADTTTKAYPRVVLTSSAIIESGKDKFGDKTKAGVYSSGWAIWKIHGTVKGCTGLYMKSGDINLNGANIQSTYGGAHEAPVSNIPGAGGTGAGSAIVINSANGGYAGGMSVTIEGDTKVSGGNGSAIEEAVTTSDKTTAVNVITIESGTFENSGSEPAIVVDAHTTSDPDATITVGGGTWSDNSAIDEGLVGTGGFATTTTNEEGQQVIVISNTGEGGSAVKWQANPNINNDSITSNSYDKLINTGDATLDNQTLSADKTIKYLTMAAGTSLTIPTNKTLTVGEVVLDWDNTDPSNPTFATITIKAGGKLIVTGEKGILSPSNNCIVIESQSANTGIFLFNDAVQSNSHPRATFKFNSKAKYDSSTGVTVWQRFGIPTYTQIDNLTCSSNTLQTAFYKFNYPSDSWDLLGFFNNGLTDFSAFNEPFTTYNMLTNDATGCLQFIFYGKLVGNDDANLTLLEHTWNGYANSYSANIDIKKLFDVLGGGVDKAVYVYAANGPEFTWESIIPATYNSSSIKSIESMQGFIFRNPGAEKEITLDYGDLVYTPATAAGAPARIVEDAIAPAVKMSVARTDGLTDNVILFENGQFSDDFDNGYEAVKYMNANMNVYVSAEDAMSIFASDNLQNTYVGFSSVTGGDFTLSFNGVTASNYALMDLENNMVFAIEEGETYTFSVDANYNNDYRFKIVERQEMPTNVETIENVIPANGGIYTITGQYLGEMNEWNNLPSGLYIVNGEKKVK